jgi:adenylyltransferase/sulfurtransferase
MLQAIETIKLIIGIGESLIGRLLQFDALTMKFREFKLRRDSQCPICGEVPSITEPIDYEQFCGLSADAAGAIPTISVRDLKKKIDVNDAVVIIDVREPFEYEIARIEPSKLIPLTELPERLDELNRTAEIVAMCKSGVRSGRAIEFLQRSGFERAFNLEGGIDAWANEIDPTMQKY